MYQPTKPMAEIITRSDVKSPFRIGELVVPHEALESDGSRRLKADGTIGPDIVVTHLYNGLSGAWAPHSFIAAEISFDSDKNIIFGQSGGTRRAHEVVSTGVIIEAKLLTAAMLRLQFGDDIDVDKPDLSSPRRAGRWHMVTKMIREEFVADKIVNGEAVSDAEIMLNTERLERKSQIAAGIIDPNHFTRNPSEY